MDGYPLDAASIANSAPIIRATIIGMIVMSWVKQDLYNRITINDVPKAIYSQWLTVVIPLPEPNSIPVTAVISIIIIKT